MIIRKHQSEGVESEAVYSPCELYRYSLTRSWDADGPRLVFIMLNPSKATELANDPTVERCERRARALGYGAFRVCNIFAWRETHPKLLRKATHPIGPENRAILIESAKWADTVICAWGVHGDHLRQGTEITNLLQQTNAPLFHLGLTKDGHPRHPLYVAYATQPQIWNVG